MADIGFAVTWLEVNVSVEFARHFEDRLWTPVREFLSYWENLLRICAEIGGPAAESEMFDKREEMEGKFLALTWYLRRLSVVLGAKFEGQQIKKEDIPETSIWWKDDEPTSESKFHGNGPVKASLTKMAQWLDADKRTLKKNNGGTWWIQKVHRRSYHFWFTSNEKYAEMNQKAIKESQRASNDMTSPRCG